MKLLNRYRSPFDLLLPIGDVIFAVVVVAAVNSWMVVAEPAGSGYLREPLMQAAAMALFVVFSFYLTDLYAIDTALNERERLFSLMNGFGIVCLCVGAIGILTAKLVFGDIRLIDLVLVGSGLFIWHQGFARGLIYRPLSSKILIVGTHTIGRLVAEQLYLSKHLKMEVVGFIGAHRDSITLRCGNPGAAPLYVFPHHTILNLVRSKGVDRILVEGPESCGDFPAQDLMTLRLRGIRIEDCHSFYERVMSRIPITDLHPGWVVLASGFRRSLWVRLVKRTIDIVLSIVCLIIFAPLFLIAAIAIKLNSRGPVFYSQGRTGLGEKLFTLYKFRSMSDNAEAETGPVWAGSDDPRVTRVGNILRKFRIDELPQLFNVLRGEMSMVGPRPERPFFIARFKETVPYYHLRFAVKPGITGWAQISFPYAATDDDAVRKLEYELYYIKNHSPLFDLEILLLTIKTVLVGRGAQ